MNKGAVYLVGAGIGGGEMISVKGLELLQSCDVVVYDRLLSMDLLKEVPSTAEKIDAGKIASMHTLSQSAIQELLVEKALQGKRVVRLKGGDPYIFGRGGEEAEYLHSQGIEFEVVPGITSGAAALCFAGIPATHRDFSSSLHFITGHKKENLDLEYATLAKLSGTLVFYMGFQNSRTIAAGLLAHGMSPKIPAAFISRGGYPDQQVITTTLEELLLSEKRPLPSPTILVIGEVVSLRDKLNFFEKKPLFGRKIVVTRARSQSGKLSRQLKNLGADVVELPVIRVEIENQDALQETLLHLSGYTHIGFTSANGVHIFMKALLQNKDVRSLAHCKLCAIGEGTGEAFAQYGLRADIIPPSFVAESMAETMLKDVTPQSKVLLPRARQGREILRQILEQRCPVDEIFIYDVVKEPLDEDVRRRLEEEEFDFITFTSSSTVKNTSLVAGEGLFNKLQKLGALSIGPITTQTANAMGFQVLFEAPVHTVDSLCSTLVDYCAKDSTDGL